MYFSVKIRYREKIARFSWQSIKYNGILKVRFMIMDCFRCCHRKDKVIESKKVNPTFNYYIKSPKLWDSLEFQK